jgi:hypothetical protein
MKTFNVYVETENGDYLDDYILEARNIDSAYMQAYELHNWQPVTVYVDEVEPMPGFDSNPLDKFPTIWSKA